MSFTDVFVYMRECEDSTDFTNYHVLQDGIVMKVIDDQVVKYGYFFGNFLGCDYSYMLVMNGDQGGVLDFDKPCPIPNKLDAIQFLRG